MNEWHVWGPRGYQWIQAKNGDEACEKYRARYQLPMYSLDEMSVDDVRATVPDHPRSGTA